MHMSPSRPKAESLRCIARPLLVSSLAAPPADVERRESRIWKQEGRSAVSNLGRQSEIIAVSGSTSGSTGLTEQPFFYGLT
jgi:hypothetical protein